MSDSNATADAPFVPDGKRIFVLVAAILASAMGFIDGSVTSIATPAIRASIDASLADAQWVSNAYLLTLSSLLLLGGAAGDRYGLRNVFVAGISVFVVASIGSALAPNPPLLIAARAIQGAGAAFMVPGSLAIIAKAYPKDARGGAIGIWAAASSLTTLLGPVIGGFLLTWLGDWSWRLIFALNLPLGGAAIALLLAQVPADQPESGRRLDVLGAVTVTVALLLISLAFIDSEGGRFWPYLVGGLAVLALFLYWERRSKAPMLPLSLFADKGFSGAQGLTLGLYFGLAAISFYLPMTMIAGWAVSPAVVSLVMLPVGICLSLLSPFAGRMTDRFGPAPVLTFGAVVIGIAFAGLGLTAGLHSAWFAVLPLMVVFGFGLSFVAGPVSTAVMTSVADRDTGTASAINNAVARVAGLFAVAMMGALAAWVFAGAGNLPAGSSFGLAPPQPLPADAETARVAATDRAFATIAYVTAGLAALSAAVAWTTQAHKGKSHGKAGGKADSAAG
ncbi:MULTISPECIES: MFS transporter [unclassified Devosia]|uniref:MFS transporter n=1 Tax=unclassified Devosia TaxID=196773 RepID=UPI000A42A50E|nr:MULTISPECIES: MFS transporter [unclassified Devosia]MBN9304633.1 MFS transporter [Devosia sp.]